MQAFRVPWSSASFLCYVGGLTVLAALASLLDVQAGSHGAGGFSGWALLIFAATTGIALAARATGHRVVAGLVALSAVGAFVVFLGSLLEWFGWLSHHSVDSPFAGFRVSWLVLELAVIASSALALAVFRFPFLVLPIAAGTWFFVTDLLSGGGDWSATVTLLAGLALLAAATAVDHRGGGYYAFWVHVVAGLTIGGALLWFFHDGDWDWVLIGIAGVLYLATGDVLARSNWTVLGAWGILQTAGHFANKWSDVGTFTYLFPFVLVDAFEGTFGRRPSHPWAGPLVFVATGAVFIALGLLVARRRRVAEPL